MKVLLFFIHQLFFYKIKIIFLFKLFIFNFILYYFMLVFFFLFFFFLIFIFCHFIHPAYLQVIHVVLRYQVHSFVNGVFLLVLFVMHFHVLPNINQNHRRLLLPTKKKQEPNYLFFYKF